MRLALLACASLALAAVAMSSGCLITDPPQFKLPTRTRPLLDVTSANRDPADVVVIDSNSTTPVTFSVDVISQEDPSDTSDFNKLQSRFFIDYGIVDSFKPYRSVGPSGIKTMSDGKRRVTATWYPESTSLGPGCHRLTLFVMHAVDNMLTQCPTCPDDYSSITWKLFLCDPTKNACDSLPLNGDGECPELKNTCSSQLAKLADAGIETDTCPETDSADGGSP